MFFYKKDKALQQREKEMKNELRSYFGTPALIKNARSELDKRLKNKKYIEARDFTRSQLNKTIQQTSGTDSQGYYTESLQRFNKRFPQ